MVDRVPRGNMDRGERGGSRGVGEEGTSSLWTRVWEGDLDHHLLLSVFVMANLGGELALVVVIPKSSY
jgi:hypothetical protein